jgi:hypothetical protein
VSDLSTHRGARGTGFPLQLRGPVAFEGAREGPLGITLTGHEELSGERVQLAFAARATQDLPKALDEARIEQLGARRYRISSGAREWIVEGVAHLHRDLANAFSAALPPRTVPWHKRLFWRVLLALAANRWARGVLLRSTD